MALGTTRTEHGDWQVKGLPFVISKDPYEPKWGERQEWCLIALDDEYRSCGDGRVLGRGYDSKAAALDALERILQLARCDA